MTQALLSRYSESVVRPKFVDSNKIEVVEVVYLSNEHTWTKSILYTVYWFLTLFASNRFGWIYDNEYSKGFCKLFFKRLLKNLLMSLMNSSLLTFPSPFASAALNNSMASLTSCLSSRSAWLVNSSQERYPSPFLILLENMLPNRSSICCRPLQWTVFCRPLS